MNKRKIAILKKMLELQKAEAHRCTLEGETEEAKVFRRAAALTMAEIKKEEGRIDD